MSGSRRAWFGCWKCECTTLAAAWGDVPKVCPEHGTYLLGAAELVTIERADLPLGFLTREQADAVIGAL